MIEFRLREPLTLKSRDQRLIEAVTGRALPATVVPARTTLRAVDVFPGGLLALTPDGKRILVSPETCRRAGYLPRGS